MGRFTGLIGLVLILASAWLFSAHRRAIRPRILLWGISLQFLFALLVLRPAIGSVLLSGLNLVFGAVWFLSAIRSHPERRFGYFWWRVSSWLGTSILVLIIDFGKVFQRIGVGVNAMLNYAEAGSNFVFGPLGIKSGPFGVVFAFQVLPIVIFIAAFFAILYYLGVMQWIVRLMAIGMQKVMGVSGAESLNVAASIFMGQTEAPLTIRPFLAGLTESELFTIMTSGMAHVSGAVMAAYVKIAGVQIEHLLTAVIMTAPATLMLAKIFYPEVDKPATAGKVEIKVEKTAVNVIDAAARGAGDGLHLALNIAGMLIAFLALIAMLNGILGWLHTMPALGRLVSFVEWIFGILLSLVAWVMGVPWKDTSAIGNLLGTRLVLNEFVAFLRLGPLKGQLDPRSFTIATYALCGFANLSSIAIQIGGIGALAPNRKSDLARLGLKAVAAGSMANFMSACIAGMLL
jgi:CNT family concentrative nucleoside transporter